MYNFLHVPFPSAAPNTHTSTYCLPNKPTTMYIQISLTQQLSSSCITCIRMSIGNPFLPLERPRYNSSTSTFISFRFPSFAVLPIHLRTWKSSKYRVIKSVQVIEDTSPVAAGFQFYRSILNRPHTRKPNVDSQEIEC